MPVRRRANGLNPILCFITRCTLPLVMVLPLLCQPAFADEPARTMAQYMHTSWGEKDGAPSSIEAIAQTTDGYLWLACFDGLFRFDGITFEKYQPQSGGPLLLSGAMALLALPNGDLWVGYNSGRVVLLRKGNLKIYTPAADGVAHAPVWSLAQTRDQSIWAATAQGLERLNGGKWKPADSDWNLPKTSTRGMYVDHQGTLWVATVDSVYFLREGARKFQLASQQLGEVDKFSQAPDGQVWMAETTNSSVRPVPLAGNRPSAKNAGVKAVSQAILFDHEGGLWIATSDDGLRHIAAPDLQKGNIDESSSAMDSFTTKDGLSGSYVLSILEDRQHNIWVTTISGLDRFRKTDLVPVALPDKFNQTFSCLIAGDDGDAWLGNQLSLMRIHEGRADPQPTAPGILQFAFRDAAGAIWWIGDGGFYSLRGGKYLRRPLPPMLPKGYQNLRMAAVEDSSGALWMAARGEGLFYWNAGKWQKIDAPQNLNLLAPTTAYLDSKGRVWVGYGEGGIAIIDHAKIVKMIPENDVPSLGIGVIYSRGLHLWVTGGGGLSYFDGTHFQRVVPFDAKRFVRVLGVEETADGSLWIIENRGVIQIPAAEVRHFLSDFSYPVKYRLFDASDGLLSSFKSPGSSNQREALGTDGKLWFVTARNLFWLDPAHLLPPDTVPPPVVIRSFGASGAPVLSLEDLRLPARTTDVQIGYTALDLALPEKLQFRYMLEGVDKNWKDAGTRRDAFYTRLGPGKYHFRVIACNRDGVWNQQGAALGFSIAPAWFQTDWFYAFCVCAFLLLLWLLFQLRSRQLRRQFNATIDARVDERTRIARELHDTLLQSFQGALFQFQAARKLSLRGADNATEAMNEAIHAAEQGITEGRDAIRDLRPESATQRSLPELLRDAGGELATALKLSGPVPEIHVIVEGDPQPMPPVLQTEVYQICREVIRNAFAHAAATRIEVEIRYDPTQLCLCIRDDGKGMEPSILKSGGLPGHFGLPGMRERAERVGARLDFWSEIGAGTEVQLTVPASLAYQKRRHGRRFRFFRRAKRHE